MNNYIVQVRFSHYGRLVSFGTFSCADEVSAIVAVCEELKEEGSNVVEIIVTEDVS